MTAPLIKNFISWQMSISKKFDGLLPEALRIYGTADFDTEVLPSYLRSGMTVYDIGGGKHPNLTPEQKNNFDLAVVGLDISGEELENAPAGIYDKVIVADICDTNRTGEADLVICRALLEHVADCKAAIKNIAALTNKGGTILIFVPCKNALYSRLNMLLPEKLKRKLLNYTLAKNAERHGFKAYYDCCTPEEFIAIARQSGLELVERRLYYASNYFSVLTPVHILWRFYQLGIRAIKADNWCETFILVFRK
jgi:2-polyprenyl-6-hydroxyphenyl methylase/3-demethylubiquinone-9 3-methyltransferase